MDDWQSVESYGDEWKPVESYGESEWKPVENYYSLGEKALAHTKNVAGGALETLGGFKGVAETTALLGNETDPWYRNRVVTLSRGGLSIEKAKARAEQELNERLAAGVTTPPPAEDPRQSTLYRAGQAVEDVGKLIEPGPAVGEGLPAALSRGAGSMGAGMIVGMVPGGAPIATTMFTGSAQAEAADRARKAGQSPEAVREAARLGTIPGLTDIVDVELARRSFGSGPLWKRLFRGAVTGGLVEGTQEGFQQFLQNAIAKKIYEPEGDLWKDVPESALVGAILGAGAKGTIEGIAGRKRGSSATPPDATVDTTVPAAQPAAAVPAPTVSSLLGSPAQAATVARVGAPAGPAATTTPAAPTVAPAPAVAPAVDSLPASAGGPPLSLDEKYGLQLERQILQEEMATATQRSLQMGGMTLQDQIDLQQRTARLQRIENELRTHEEAQSQAEAEAEAARSRMKPKEAEQSTAVPAGPVTAAPRSGPERYTIQSPLGAKSDEETWNISVLRSPTGVPEALVTPFSVVKIGPAYQGLPIEQIIATELGDHAAGVPADVSKVRPAAEPAAEPATPAPTNVIPLRGPEPNAAVLAELTTRKEAAFDAYMAAIGAGDPVASERALSEATELEKQIKALRGPNVGPSGAPAPVAPNAAAPSNVVPLRGPEPVQPLHIIPEPAAGPAPNESPVHALGHRRLELMKSVGEAAKSGDMVEFRRLKNELLALELEWQKIVPSGEPTDDDPSGPRRDVWHGSPIRHAGFDTKYLGTGEGGAAWGEGFYFAEQIEVTKTYLRQKEAEALMNMALRQMGGEREGAAIFIRNKIKNTSVAHKSDWENALAILEGRRPGHTTFGIKLNVEENELLNMDNVWAAQPKGVREKLTKLREDPVFKERERSSPVAGQSWRGQTGKAIYYEIARILGGGDYAINQKKWDWEASKLLLKYEIPGSVFLDQFSRAGMTKSQVAQLISDAQKAGQTKVAAQLAAQLKTTPEKLTRNFVIFDPQRIGIMTIDGEPFIQSEMIDPAMRQASDVDQAAQLRSVLENKLRSLGDVAAFSNVQVMTIGADGHTTVKKVPVSEAPVSANVRGSSNKVKTILEAQRNDFLIPQEEIPTNEPIVFDHTVVELSDVESKMFSQIAQEKFGARFFHYVHSVGLLMKAMRDDVAKLVTSRNGVAGQHYSDLMNQAVGVAIDFGNRSQGVGAGGHHGLSIRFPFKAFFINPFLLRGLTWEEIALNLYHTMVHEFTHLHERDESVGHGPFAAEMQRLLSAYEANMPGRQALIKQELLRLVRENQDMLREMRGVVDGHNVRSTGDNSTAGQSGPTGNGQSVADVSASGGESERGGGLGPRYSSVSSRLEPVPDDARLPGDGKGFVTAESLGITTNARALKSEGASSAVPAVPIQPVTRGVRKGLKRVFAGRPPGRAASSPAPAAGIGHNQGGGAAGGAAAAPPPTGGNVGGLPPTVAGAAAHADSVNVFWKWWYGLDQMRANNPDFTPIVRYAEDAQRMHLEEADIHGGALEIAKQWRRLTESQGKALNSVIHDIVRMAYLTPQEVAQNVVRQPTQAEIQALYRKHKLKPKGQAVHRAVNASLDAFLAKVVQVAVDEAQRNTSDPAKLAAALNKIAQQVVEIKKKPFFPLTRFGTHFVRVEDASGAAILFETFERRGPFKSARYFQKRRAEELRKQLQPGETVVEDIFPVEADPLTAMPTFLLQSLQGQSTLTPSGLAAIQQLQMTSARHFKSKFTNRSMTPGYSLDFLRGYAKYFFHGGRYYAQTKYGWKLRGSIQMARGIRTNKATQMADYMTDHLKNTVLDPRGDYGKLKGVAFLWTIGYVPSAALINMAQTPAVTFPFLADKFGPAVASYHIMKAMGQISTYYRRGTYAANQTSFVSRALSYGIKTGRISETQAPELAGLGQSNNLANTQLGNARQRAFIWTMENSAVMFEMAEQVNRRVAYRATLELALKYPNSPAVAEAVKLHPGELNELMTQFSPAEARAIITANNAVEETQGNYAKWARPRFLRHPVANVLFMYKKYMQTILTLMRTHGKSYTAYFLLVNMLMYGMMGGFPGAEDILDFIKGLVRKMGFRFNPEEEVRKYILDISSGRIEPDLILHGMASRGWGLPAAADMFGEHPGRGLLMNGPGQNVPMPTFDRSAAGGMGKVLPVSPGKLLDPTKDAEQAIGEQVSRGAGPAFGVAFNLYKAIEDNRSGVPKAYEKAMPRFLGNASKVYRYFGEGRERSGLEGGGATVIPYNVHDTEQLAEIIGVGLGYQSLRNARQWNQIMATAEVTKKFHIEREVLNAQYYEAWSNSNMKGMEDVKDSILRFNTGLPEWAKGQTITSDTLKESIQRRAVAREHREAGVPVQKGDVGIAQYIQGNRPGAIVDVRPVK